MKGAKSKAESRKADSRLSVKRKGADRASKKPAKKAKDPNKPKRAPTAFFVFLEEFRKQYKEKHPENKSVAAVGKAAGEKWKAMSDAEKAPYVTKSNQRKAMLQKSTALSEKKQEAVNHHLAEDESDKSKSEVNDEDDEESGEEDEEDD
uniref:HMG1/2-like protein n=1 Tax=Anthurium amnicola TaxID=1678845 RepID=A0A1D1Z8T4_9ARAE